MSHPHRYVLEAQASTGFCVIDNGVAWQLRPDLWTNPREVMCTLGEPDTPLKGVYRLTASLGSRRVLILARSMTRLVERIEEITGLHATGLAIAEPSAKPAAPPDAMTAYRQRQMTDHKARIERLAKQVPPAHDCALRREILAARAELGGDDGGA